MTLRAGVRVGPYEIEGRIGAGGMGEVFRARDTRLGRSVAVKVLPAAYGEDKELRARLEREARAISQLAHPHICTLYDVGTHEGVPYLVLELLEGETLAQRLGRGPLPTADVLRYGTHVAQALARAHRAGIVHRDLKPGNVMITGTGAKLLDFGLARQSGPESPSDDSSTAHGALIGTVPYMAPEQLARQRADERSDVYALGAILYEMATGHRAFDGRRTPAPGPSPSSSELTIDDERRPALPPGARQVLHPAALEHLVSRCLAPDPATRWQSAHDVAQQLAFLADHGDVATATEAPRARRVWWGAVAVTVACVAAAGAAWAGRTRAVRPLAESLRFTVPVHTESLRLAAFGLLSPDGQRLAIRGRPAGNPVGHGAQLYVHSFDTFGFQPVPGTEDLLGGAEAWSPDGRELLFLRDNKLYRVPWRSGPVGLVAEFTPPVLERGQLCGSGTPCSAWTGRGDILTGYFRGTLGHLAPGTATFDEVPTRVPLPPGEAGLGNPTLLPDDRTFLVMSFNEGGAAGRLPTLYAGRIGEGIVKSLGQVGSRVYYSSGHLFHLRGGALLATPFDPVGLTLGTSSHVVARDVWQWAWGMGAFHAAGGTVAYRQTPRPDQVWLVSENGDRLRPIGPTMLLWERCLSLRPDGAEIAVLAGLPERNHPEDLWTFGVDRPTLVRVTDVPGPEFNPVYGHDGRELFYARDWDIRRRTLGTDVDVVIQAGPNAEYPEGVSPDGRHLLYMEYQEVGTFADLLVLPLGGGPPRVFAATRARELRASFSPDGRWVIYMSDATGRFEVYAQPFPGPGAPVQVSTAGGRNPRWSPDGRSVYYVHGDHEVHVAPFRDGRPGESRRLFRVRESITEFVGVRHDGHLILALHDERLMFDAPIHVITNWRPDTPNP